MSKSKLDELTPHSGRISVYCCTCNDVVLQPEDSCERCDCCGREVCGRSTCKYYVVRHFRRWTMCEQCYDEDYRISNSPSPQATRDTPALASSSAAPPFEQRDASAGSSTDTPRAACSQGTAPAAPPNWKQIGFRTEAEAQAVIAALQLPPDIDDPSEPAWSRIMCILGRGVRENEPLVKRARKGVE